MSIEAGRAYFRQFGMEDRVQEFTVSSATVDLAAKALGVEGARIAKTLSFKTADGCMLILAAGDARIDNHKFKEKFHMKAKMLSADEVVELVGHPVGGVCPFGCKEGIPVYLDVSLQRFETVFPAVGSPSSAIDHITSYFPGYLNRRTHQIRGLFVPVLSYICIKNYTTFFNIFRPF